MNEKASYIPESDAERAFLESYDPYIYKAPSIAADTALFAFDARESALKLLLIRRGGYPYRGRLALPGGFANVGEHMKETASRELLEETGINGVYSECHYCLGAPDRDPRHHIVSPEYLALTSIDRVRPTAGDDAAKAAWYTLTAYSESATAGERERTTVCRYTLAGEDETLSPVITITERYGEYKDVRVEITDAAGMAFDHAKAVFYALRRLRERLTTSDIAYNALPEEFEIETLEALCRASFTALPKTLPGLRSIGSKYTFLPQRSNL